MTKPPKSLILHANQSRTVLTDFMLGDLIDQCAEKGYFIVPHATERNGFALDVHDPATHRVLRMTAEEDDVSIANGKERNTCANDAVAETLASLFTPKPAAPPPQGRPRPTLGNYVGSGKPSTELLELWNWFKSGDVSFDEFSLQCDREHIAVQDFEGAEEFEFYDMFEEVKRNMQTRVMTLAEAMDFLDQRRKKVEPFVGELRRLEAEMVKSDAAFAQQLSKETGYHPKAQVVEDVRATPLMGFNSFHQ